MRTSLFNVWTQISDWDRTVAINSYLKYHDMAYLSAAQFGFPGYVGAAVFSALSPNNDYHGNLRDMRNLLSAASDGRKYHQFTVSTYGNNKMKAWRIVHGADPLELIVASKTRSFYLNINNPLDPQPVTIDGHMVNIWRGKRENLVGLRGITPKTYEQVAQAVRDFAREVGLIPNQVQALLWQTWRRIHGIQTSPQTQLWDVEFQKAGLGWHLPYENTTKTQVSHRPKDQEHPQVSGTPAGEKIRDDAGEAEASWVGSIHEAPDRPAVY